MGERGIWTTEATIGGAEKGIPYSNITSFEKKKKREEKKKKTKKLRKKRKTCDTY
jgi:hypothetical protein